MGSITIDGVTYSGNNIKINKDTITIDGEQVSMKKQDSLKIEGFIDTLICDRNVDVHNSTVGSIQAKGSVTCDDVGGDVHAGGSVSCDDVDGNVNAGGSVNCDDIGGDVTAGGSIKMG